MLAVVVVVVTLAVAADNPFAGCRPDSSSQDLVLDCGDIVLTVEEEVGGDARTMLEKHLAGVRDDVAGADVDAPIGLTATYKHNDVIATVQAKPLVDVTRVVSCGAPVELHNARCTALLDALMKQGSTAFPDFFRARDVEKSWKLPTPTADCRVRRGNVVFTLDCEAFGFSVAKADGDARKRDAGIRRMVSEMERGAGVATGLHSIDACTLHGAPASCMRAEIKGVHVVVAAGVVSDTPLQARCDWDGPSAMPSTCAAQIVLPADAPSPSPPTPPPTVP